MSNKTKQILQYSATLFSILGILLISLKLVILGYLVSLVATFLWIYYGYVTKQWGIVINSFGYLIAEIIGIINWMN